MRGIEVNDDTISLDVIKESALGPGHFLGHAQTLELMQSEYLYPQVADRDDYNTWKENGALDARQKAAHLAKVILNSNRSARLDPQVDHEIRSNFDIRLN